MSEDTDVPVSVATAEPGETVPDAEPARMEETKHEKKKSSLGGVKFSADTPDEDEELPKETKPMNLVAQQSINREGRIKAAFDKFDKDGSGKISKVELGGLLATLGFNPDEEVLQGILSTMDLDNSGDIDYQEFKTMMEKTLEKNKIHPRDVSTSKNYFLAIITLFLSVGASIAIWLIWQDQAGSTVFQLIDNIMTKVRQRTLMEVSAFTGDAGNVARLMQALATTGSLSLALLPGNAQALDQVLHDQIVNFGFEAISVVSLDYSTMAYTTEQSTGTCVGICNNTPHLQVQGVKRDPQTDKVSREGALVSAKAVWESAKSRVDTCVAMGEECRTGGWTNVEMMNGHPSMIHYSGLYDTSGNLTAVLGLHLDLDKLGKIVESRAAVEQLPNLRSVVTDASGSRLISSSDWSGVSRTNGVPLVSESKSEAVRAVGEYLGSPTKQIPYTGNLPWSGDTPMYTTISRAEGLNWTISTVIPSDTFSTVIEENNWVSSVLLIILFSLTIVLSVCFIKVVPHVGAANRYRRKRLHLGRANGLMSVDPVTGAAKWSGGVPPKEKNPKLEWYRQLTFEVDLKRQTTVTSLFQSQAERSDDDKQKIELAMLGAANMMGLDEEEDDATPEPGDDDSGSKAPSRWNKWLVETFDLVNGNTMFYILGALLMGVMLCLASIWLLWSVRVAGEVEKLNQIGLEQTGIYVSEEITYFMSSPAKANVFLRQSHARGDLVVDPIAVGDIAPRDKRDRLLYDVLNAYKKPNGEYGFSMVYYGYKGVELQGSQVYTSNGNVSSRCAAKDENVKVPTQCMEVSPGSLLTQCYTKYPYVNGVRNDSATFGDSGYTRSCTYNPGTRSWWLDTKKNGVATMGAPYSFAGGGAVGVSLSLPIFNSTTDPREMIASVVVDLGLPDISKFLLSIIETAPGGTESNLVFVITNPETDLSGLSQHGTGQKYDGIVVGSSDTASCGAIAETSLLKTGLSEAVEPRMQAVSAYIQRVYSSYADDMDKYEKEKKEGKSPEMPEQPIPPTGVFISNRLATDPVSAFSFIRDEKSGVDLLSITLLDKAVYTAVMDSYQTFSLLMAGFIILILGLLSEYAFKSLKGLYTEDPEDEAQQLGDEAPSFDSLQKTLAVILPLVKEATTLDKPPDTSEEEEEEYFLNRAARYIVDQRMGRNVLTMCALRVQEQGYFKLLVYQIRTDGTYRTLFNCMLLCHILLDFFVPSTPIKLAEYGYPDWIFTAEFFFLCFEFIDCAMRLVVNHRWIPSAGYSKSGLLGCATTADIKPHVDCLYLALLLLMFFNWLAVATSRVSMEYTFPLRVWLLLTCNVSVWDSVQLFFTTTVKAKDVFLLLISIIGAASCIAVTLFRGVVAPDSFKNGFDSFLDTLLTISAYVTTADNYSDTMYNVQDQEELNGGLLQLMMSMFWIILTIIGLFFLIGIVLGYFQNEFSAQREQVTHTNRFNSRIGLVAAFGLVDTSGDGALDADEFMSFVKVLDSNEQAAGYASKMMALIRPFMPSFFAAPDAQVVRGVHHPGQEDGIELQAKAGDALQQNPAVPEKEKTPEELALENSDFFKRINSDGDAEIDILEFTVGIEDSFSLLKKYSKPRETCGIVWRDIIEDDRVTSIRLALCICQLFLVSLYGLNAAGITDEGLDAGLTVILLFFVFEIAFGIWIYGFSEFWSYERYNSDVKFIALANRFEFIICLVSVFSFLIAVSSAGCVPLGAGCSFNADDSIDGYTRPAFRVVFALSSLRLLSLLQTTRYMVAILVSVLPRFLPLIANLFMFMSIYATYGVYLFSNGWEALAEDDRPDANFSAYDTAFLGLFELLIGNAWTDTMYAAMEVYGKHVLWYFISYVSLVTLLFCNLFLGILLDAFGTFLEMSEVAKLEMEKSLSLGMDIKTVNTNLVLARDRALRSIS